MTIEIPEDVLSEVMLLTGKPTKRDAVEFALREAARRAKQARIWGEGLGLTQAQLAAEAAPQPSDVIDAPDIDNDAVRQSQDPLAELKRFEHDYDFAINGVIWAEVVRSRSDPHVRRRYELAFSVARMLSLTPRGWQRVADLAWELDRRGDVIPLTDLIIAATAIEHRAAILTFDRHFQRIPGVVAVSDLS